MMVTRVAADDSLGADLGSQLLRRPEVLRAAGLLSFALACVPVLPHALFATFGVVLLVIAQAALRSKRAEMAAEAAATDARVRSEARRPEAAFSSVGTDLVSIDLGRDLMALFSPENSEQIIERIVEARRMIARETGVVLAGVHIRDDAAREPDTYEIRFRGEVVGSGGLMLDRYMAIANSDSTGAIDGEPGLDPLYGFPITWIARGDRDYAMSVGAIALDAITVLVSHVTECARLRATLLFGRQEMQTLLEHLKPTHPAIVKETGTDTLPFATVHKAFTILLRERVWPRNPIAALEAMIDAAATSRDPRELPDAARRLLVAPMLHSRQLKELLALMFDPVFEAQLCAAWIGADGAAADPQLALHIRAEVDAYVKSERRRQAYIVCTSPFRRQLSDLLDRFGLRADVLSFGELPTDIAVKPTVIVTTPSAKKALAAAS